MIGRLYEIVVDCPDPRALAVFYRELTGLDELFAADDWVTLGRGTEVRLAFQVAPDLVPAKWPDPSRPQQMHLDVFVADIDDAERRVLLLGATRLAGGDDKNRIFADPAGHPFCLCLDNPDAP